MNMPRQFNHRKQDGIVETISRNKFLLGCAAGGCGVFCIVLVMAAIVFLPKIISPHAAPTVEARISMQPTRTKMRGSIPSDPTTVQIPTETYKPRSIPTSTPIAKIKVGLSFSDFATEHWKNEADLMMLLLKGRGYEVIVTEANHDVRLQNDQIEYMVAQGVEGLIIIAEDGDAVASEVDKAARAGVKVIAYDRLIKTANIALYLSFNMVDVGRQEALGVMKALGIPGSAAWTKDNPARIVLSGGSPTDVNAHLVRQGQMEIIQPYLDQGIVKVVADQWVDNWDATNAEKMMENILVALQNQVDGVIASNDGTALGELLPMKIQGLAGKVPISGQDATADGCNSIVKGELTVTVFKDIRLLSPIAVDLMDKLIQGESIPQLKSYTLTELTLDSTQSGAIQVFFLPVVPVGKENVYDIIVKSGFQSYDDVYRDIPTDQRPPKP